VAVNFHDKVADLITYYWVDFLLLNFVKTAANWPTLCDFQLPVFHPHPRRLGIWSLLSSTKGGVLPLQEPWVTEKNNIDGYSTLEL